MNYLKHKNQLYLMQLVEEKNNKMGGNMKYTEKDLERIDQEIALLNSKLVELQQKRSLIKTFLLDSAISERTEESDNSEYLIDSSRCAELSAGGELLPGAHSCA